MLSCRLKHARLSRTTNKQHPVSIEVARDNLLPRLGLLSLVDGANLGILLLRQGTGSNSPIPRNRSLANVALQRAQVRRRVERHGDGVAAAKESTNGGSAGDWREEDTGMGGGRGEMGDGGRAKARMR